MSHMDVFGVRCADCTAEIDPNEDFVYVVAETEDRIRTKLICGECNENRQEGALP
jgi:hypothetical protein